MKNATDFFDSANTVSFDARNEQGLPASLDDRHSVGVLGRVLQRLKDSAGPIVSALAVAAVATAVSLAVAPVQSMDAGSGNLLQAVHAMLANLSAAPVAGSPAALPSQKSDSSISHIDIYNASMLKAENAKTSESETGLSQQFIHDLAVSTISPDAKKYIEKLDVVKRNILSGDNTSVNMMSLENKERKTVCIMQLGSFNEELTRIIGTPIKVMYARDADSLRRVVIAHEAAHCEQGALQNANAAGFGPNFVADMNNVASGFSAVMPDKHVVDYSKQAKTLMGERYADSKVVLSLANSHLSHLRETSTSAERNEALSNFKQDISQIKRLRIQERTLHSKYEKFFNDHDTLHVVESLEITVIANAKDPKKWKAWSGKYLGEEQMAPAAGAIALGSVLAERNEIARENIKVYVQSLKDQSLVLMNSIQQETAYITTATEKLAKRSAVFEAERMSPGADPRGQKPGISASEYSSLYVSSLVTATARLRTANHLSKNEHLRDSDAARIEDDGHKNYPASRIALKTITAGFDLSSAKETAQKMTEELQEKQLNLSEIIKIIQPGLDIKQSIGEALPESAKSFSMKGHAFWTRTQSQSVAAGDIHKSFLMDRVQQLANGDANKAEKYEPGQAKSSVNSANFVSPVRLYATRAPVASGLLKMLGSPPPASQRPLSMTQPQPD